MPSRLERVRRDWKPDWASWVPGEVVEALRSEYMPDMPPLDRGAYLVNYLFEIGPASTAGMGLGPITHEAIRAWQDNTGVELAPWECRFLRRLSLEYVLQGQRAEKRDCKAPVDVPGLNLQAVDTKAAIRALAGLA